MAATTRIAPLARHARRWLGLVAAWGIAAAPGAADTPGAFMPAGSLTRPRSTATATRLASGQVLIAGGAIGNTSAELYDPATSQFTPTHGSMTTEHSEAVATLLPGGKVLIAGGLAFAGKRGYLITDGTDLYDPATGTFTRTGSLLTARIRAAATLLPNGKVLIAGGEGQGGGNTLSSAELYDPAAGKFTATGQLAVARDETTAILLPNGKVLIAGGHHAGGYRSTQINGPRWCALAPHCELASAELYDPATGKFTATGSLATERSRSAATLLPSGKVLVVGGAHDNRPLASAEIYDPSTGRFAKTGSLATARIYATATLLPGGKVLIAGGDDQNGYLASAELYDPATGTFATTGNLATARSRATATLLPSGKVLIAGGSSRSDHTSAEVYDPGSVAAAAPAPSPAQGAHAGAAPARVNGVREASECVPTFGPQLSNWGARMGTMCPGLAAAPLWDEPQFTAMLEAFRQLLPDKRRALDFQMNAQLARLRVQDPTKPQNVDSYDYFDGKLRGPFPVNLTEALNRELTYEESFFDWDRMALERIPAFIQQALDKTKIEDSKATWLVIEVWWDHCRAGFEHKAVNARVQLEGPRLSAVVFADAHWHICMVL